jgi:hypothetical protein
MIENDAEGTRPEKPPIPLEAVLSQYAALTQRGTSGKKRPVPLREYLGNKSAKVFNTLLHTSAIVVAFFLCTLFCLSWLAPLMPVQIVPSSPPDNPKPLYGRTVGEEDTSVPLDEIIARFIVAATGVCFTIGGTRFVVSKLRISQKQEDVALLTSANVTQLPPEETLVRATAKPIQNEPEVLLRPAISARDIPKEQLLRSGTTSPLNFPPNGA